ncbi:hypothetical protein G7K_6557-t1 [Saitoella complicata NRRL Y-17804]|uniref:Uncharacterized protein n=1 Tax=Saitoella complicata (strain BCRC 22490 / CBS 7301 / JCM 7358 / NBRC 10748 / NRRL Y-17804) TaxID=698492 RepID=A0A0E9NRJ0_SAICN|nr:hypothetical protein G7K_6557-t1 [Saitoella complicata NRRL Y-17804]
MIGPSFIKFTDKAAKACSAWDAKSSNGNKVVPTMTSHGRGGEGNIGSSSGNGMTEDEGFAISEHALTSPINIGGSSTSTHPEGSYHSHSTSNASQGQFPTSSSPRQRRVSLTTLNEEHGGHLGHYKGVPFYQSPNEAEKVIRQRKEKAEEPFGEISIQNPIPILPIPNPDIQ